MRGTPQDPVQAGGVTTGGSLARDLVLYTLGRLAMIAVVAAVLLVARVPLLVALAVGVVVALPLSLVVLRTLRVRVATGLAERSARRRAERERLMAELRGTTEPEDL